MSGNSVGHVAAFCDENQIFFSREELLSAHCTFKIGGAAALFCMPDTVKQCGALVSECRAHGVPYFILGKGSNVLFADEGYEGVVISTLRLCGFTLGGGTLTAQAGAALGDICKAAAENGMSGLEFAYGIPGTVGGAVYMNAGAYGGEIKDVLLSASYLDAQGGIQTVSAEKLSLSYRHSALQEDQGILLEAVFALKKDTPEKIWAAMHEYAARRVEKQPLDKPSAGSTFKRPEGAFAGALIDQCGLRGYQVGGAAVSEKHCGFVVNAGGATCKDVLRLTDEVSKIVKQKTGYLLEKEVRVVPARPQAPGNEI